VATIEQQFQLWATQTLCQAYGVAIVRMLPPDQCAILGDHVMAEWMRLKAIPPPASTAALGLYHHWSVQIFDRCAKIIASGPGVIDQIFELAGDAT